MVWNGGICDIYIATAVRASSSDRGFIERRISRDWITS